MNVSAAQIEVWRKERRQLKNRRDELSRRNLGRNIGAKARGTGLYQAVSEIDQQIAALEQQLEAAGYPLSFWE